MRSLILALGAVALWSLVGAPDAHARNPHCAGGIQYVVNGMKDKDKGKTEDWDRQMHKAVAQLEQCAEEDPKDLEALGYLGWAYAEIEEMEKAGQAFEKCIDGFKEKGDKKKEDWAINNRDSYWARNFNEGIGNINNAQAAYPEYSKEPEEGEEALKEEAGRLYEQAIIALTRASQLKPGDPQTIRNLGTAYVFMGRYEEAAEIFQRGLDAAPEDEDLRQVLRQARSQYANELINAERYDDAIGYYEGLLENDPENPDLHLGLADARFRLAQTIKDASRAAAFKDAADAYAKASEQKPGDPDLPFNAALAYQNAQEWELAAAQWEKSLAIRPGDPDALSAYASTLAELGRFDRAIEMLHRAIANSPQEQTLHRQLGAVYTKAGDNAKATEELMVYLALSKGQAVENTSAHADQTAMTQGGATAKTLATVGVPESIVPWEADGEVFETWFYWSKHVAYHFKGGTLQAKSDWSAAAAYITSDGGKP